MLRPHLLAALSISTAMLVACGGGSESAATSANAASPTSNAPATVATPTEPEAPRTEGPTVANEGAPGPRVLLVVIDGIAYDTLRQKLAAPELVDASGRLASMNIAPAFTGGRNGTLTGQRTTFGPGWASLMTGTWVDRHGVAYDSEDQRIDIARAPSMFTVLHDAQPDLKAGAVVSGAQGLVLLASDVASGAIASAVDCIGSSSCVTAKASEWVRTGYQLTVAQYAAPIASALSDGPASEAYAQVVADTLTQVGQLTAMVARRQAIDPTEDWLVLLTTSSGLDAFGSASGVQATANRTIFVAGSKPLPGLPGANIRAPEEESQLQKLAAATDIAPTVLRQLGVQTDAAHYGFAGMALQASTELRQLSATSGADKRSIELAWAISSASDADVRVLRDGQALATLPAGTTHYTDSIVEAADGNYSHRYTIVVGEAASTLTAQIAYVKPTPLAPTLANGLEVYYPLDTLPALDAKGGSTLTPWAADADGASQADDGFLAPWKAQALRIDSRLRGLDGKGGYRLQMNHDVTTDTALGAFTLGFWLRSDDICSQGTSFGGTLLANKNYDSGSNAGLAIGIFGNCELRFVLGSGSARAENKGARLSAGQWAYVAMTVDRVGKTMKSYVLDPVLGAQTGSVALTDAIIAKIGGLGTGLAINEDGTALYYQRNAAKAPPGALDFNEFAVWNRALTSAEITSLFKSGQPLSVLQP